MEWTRILAYITGTVDQELLLRNEYLAAENRILMAKFNGRPRFSDVERATLREDWLSTAPQSTRSSGDGRPA
jgi:putative transposase